MRKYLTLILAALCAFAFSGCASTGQTKIAQGTGTLLSFIATHDIKGANIQQSTATVFFNHKETITGISKVNGDLHITGISAEFHTPKLLWWFSTDVEFSAADIDISKSDQTTLASLTAKPAN